MTCSQTTEATQKDAPGQLARIKLRKQKYEVTHRTASSSKTAPQSVQKGVHGNSRRVGDKTESNFKQKRKGKRKVEYPTSNVKTDMQ